MPTAETAAALLAELQARQPLVQCLTNAVVTNFTANVLLAVGASAAMTDLPLEAGPFAAIASGVLVNLGTPHTAQRDAMREAVAAAKAAGTPWVLDPVAIGTLPVRTALAAELLLQRPTVIRGNPSEIIALAGVGVGGRGVDSVDSAEDALAAGRLLAVEFGSVVAISGPIDIVTDGVTDVRVHTGTPLLTRVTGGGCALGAVMAAFAALSDDRLASTVAATVVYTIAAEQAAADAAGPGSFAVAFLDRLANLTAETVLTLAVIR
ncbi:hydroxyethylthiazole kinase [Cryobacterium melibiosiphilum]|uniref:Hydroxyethylthiazole kinase n=1 Tax=Cryobacterium melibiosiphilum TaxID=995039 RepID=A0A3A5MN46_9MICO|nr:hydroxyethylthiazole kinase [Cryobacterium melibiosiphilum]